MITALAVFRPGLKMSLGSNFGLIRVRAVDNEDF
jgi:hypothetical protein